MTMRRRRSLAVLFLLSLAAAVALGGFVLLRGSPSGGDPGAAVEGPTLVFAEFGPTADLIYTAPAADPDRRTLVATVEHADGWGINPAPAMAGDLVAFTVLPAGSPGRRDAPAELWLLDVGTRDRTRLARDADLLVAPIFDRDGNYLVYRSTDALGEQQLVRVDLNTRARRVQHSYTGPFGVFPVGFTNDGALLFARLWTGGTDVYLVRDGGEPELRFHASDQIARDWRLSPDGRSLSYVAPERLAERVVHRLYIVDPDDGSARSVATGSVTGEQFAPVWTPAGDAVTVGQEAYPGVNAAALTLSLADGGVQPLAAPERGFDVPLGWSANGRYLAARSFDGISSFDPGRESVVVISAEGVRRLVSVETELIFLGWIAIGASG